MQSMPNIYRHVEIRRTKNFALSHIPYFECVYTNLKGAWCGLCKLNKQYSSCYNWSLLNSPHSVLRAIVVKFDNGARSILDHISCILKGCNLTTHNEARGWTSDFYIYVIKWYTRYEIEGNRWVHMPIVRQLINEIYFRLIYKRSIIRLTPKINIDWDGIESW